MKIIKRGKPPKERMWEGDCQKCRSVARATEAEMNHITFDQREGGSFSWEVCPVCEAGDINSGYGGMLFYPIRMRGE